MDENQLEIAKKHIRNAWIAGSISAVITMIYSIAGASSESFNQKFGFDLWNLLDVALLVGLSYGIYKEKRFCALGLLIYFLFSKILVFITTGQFSGGFFSLIFVYFFFQGTRYAFIIHKYKIKTGEKIIDKSGRGVGYYILVSMSVILILGFGALAIIGSLAPETYVVSGKQLKKEYADFVKQNNLIDSTEDVQYWFSDGFIDFKNGFYFFTEKKVLLYNSDWDIPKIEIPLENIEVINFEKSESSLENSMITLFLKDNSSVNFPLSNENGGDETFYNHMMELWEPHRILNQIE